MLQFILRSGTALGNTAAINTFSFSAGGFNVEARISQEMKQTVLWKGEAGSEVRPQSKSINLSWHQTSVMESMDVRSHPCVGVVGHWRARGVFCNLCLRRRWK
ncbi:hypothetical protein ILYODFUR_035836 [Ilyodon furcidens]|uniref:Uncharacterized protein n=1 Tax=Ilyodon furcidens TaxID=33524 RepID=A0ABV0V1S4_9TELE